jgi:hypothetical protein
LEWSYLEFQAELRALSKLKLPFKQIARYTRLAQYSSVEGAILMFVAQLQLLPFLAVPRYDIESP